ncbi:hypothetical protein [Halococcus sp. AFM35]|uniref:hypothetical protein n=1 Tax=Halococcus sp. AFM35 TaxID=3421653 RepID=UPI003EB90637
MTDDPLGDLEFSGDSESRTPEEFIDIIHDPDVLYCYIKDAHNKARDDLIIDAGDITEEVHVHAKVEVFQSAIQYVEAFGIYLLAYIKGRENLIADLIRTKPSEVETFFEYLQNDEIDEWLAENEIEDDYQTVLETIFGYLYLDTVEHPGEGEFTDEELQSKIDDSTVVLDSELRSIGEFYTMFHDVYNAVKHGNRAIPQSLNELQFTPHEGDDETDGEAIDAAVDMEFVLFVCKNSQGEPYLTILPIDFLLEHTLSVIEKTHNLFTHLKTISHAVIKNEPFDISFFTYTETTTDENEQNKDSEPDWITAHQPGGIFILPRTEQTAALLSEPAEWTFAARLTLDDDTLVLTTRNNNDISDDYPILVSITQQGLVGLTPRPILNLTINFTINDLDALQYYELLQFQDFLEDRALDSTRVVDEQSDTEIPVGTPDDFPLPELEEFLNRERMEQIALLQKITQQRIPMPLAVSADQEAIIDKCIEANLTREDAVEAVENIEQLGTDREFTEIVVEKRSPSMDVLETEYIDSLPGTVDFTLTDDETGENDTHDAGTVRFPTHVNDVTFDELVESFHTDGGGAEVFTRNTVGRI